MLVQRAACRKHSAGDNLVHWDIPKPLCPLCVEQHWLGFVAVNVPEKVQQRFLRSSSDVSGMVYIGYLHD
jgi:hypothetical protein